jgi:FtsZ-interacting cell division protein ZipA
MYEYIIGTAAGAAIVIAGYWISKADERALFKYLNNQQMIDKSTTDKVLNGDLLRDITAGRESTEWKEPEGPKSP